ncbi:MAG: hypothetical protein KF729_29980 [Sandaracinaceae bacterium]|nr:hypothetical protein [Sandaracinaceae bacterium]
MTGVVLRFRGKVLSAMRLVSAKPVPNARTLLASASGIVFTEYVALLLLVTVIGAVAVVSLGVPLLRLYRFAQMILSLPIP